MIWSSVGTNAHPPGSIKFSDSIRTTRHGVKSYRTCLIFTTEYLCRLSCCVCDGSLRQCFSGHMVICLIPAHFQSTALKVPWAPIIVLTLNWMPPAKSEIVSSLADPTENQQSAALFSFQLSVLVPPQETVGSSSQHTHWLYTICSEPNGCELR